MDADTLVRDYVDRLETAAAGLEADRRADLVADVRDHIANAVAEAGNDDMPTLRNILERLGSPEEIVAAEGEANAAAPATASTAQAGPQADRAAVGAIEIIALLLLTVGAVFLPFFGPLIGLVFVWLSDRWTLREKLIATAIVLILFALPLLLFLASLAVQGGAVQGGG
ncbi:MAG: HAAS signaling domain-containing protein [Solirubrobacterales bacterium]